MTFKQRESVSHPSGAVMEKSLDDHAHDEQAEGPLGENVGSVGISPV